MRAARIVLAVVLMGNASLLPCWAQSDAETALQQARMAYQQADYKSASNLLKIAAQTDGKNPDIFLLLGKSHYQLGEVEQAIVAWRKTVQLAPQQAYAKQMLASLGGAIHDTDVRIRVVESLLDADLLDAVMTEISGLRRLPLHSPQLVRLLSLEADALIRLGKFDAALKALRELEVRDPTQKDVAQTRLLSGRALVGLDEAAIAKGLVVLQSVRDDFPDTPQAAGADLSLIRFKVQQGELVVKQLADWIESNANHPELPIARRAMIDAVGLYIAESKAQDQPATNGQLADTDEAAMAAAELALPALVQSSESLQIIEQLAEHIQLKYASKFAKQESFDTATRALQRLAQLKLPTSSQVAIKEALYKVNTASASRQYETILAQLGRSDGSIDALRTWIDENSNHPQTGEARRQLLAVLLAEATRGGVVHADIPLSASETAAIAVAGDILKSIKTVAESQALVDQLMSHLNSRYGKQQAHAAMISGHQLLLELALPPVVHAKVLARLADAQTQSFLARIQADVAAGRALDRAQPADLVATLTSLDSLAKQSLPTWPQRNAIAAAMLKIAESEPWAAQASQPKVLHRWILDIALPVVQSAADSKSDVAAASIITQIVEQYEKLTQDSAANLAIDVHSQLLEAVDKQNELWPATALKQIQLQMVASSRVFQQRLRTGKGSLNAALDESQKELLGLVSELIQSRPAMAPSVVSQLTTYLMPWSAYGHDATVTAAYEHVEQNLPSSQQRQIRLKVAELWVQGALDQHQRLLSRGFQPARKLDPAFTKALVRCYELQSGLEETDPFVAQVRKLRQRVIDHYRDLKYMDVAGAAIQVKAEPEVAWLTTRAELESAQHKLNIALDELSQQVKQYPGRESIALTPSIRESIGGLQQFITQRAESPLVPQAVDLLFSVGVTYESYGKYGVAAEIYTALETFATENAALTQAKPDTPTVAQRAAHAAATALHLTATNELAELLAGQPQDAKPPTVLSDEFQAAIDAYKSIITNHGDSTLVGPAIGKIMDIALQYSDVGSWDVAEGVYAELQQQELPLRQPERLAMARALCQLGKVLPEHAQQVLAAITLWERAAPVADPPPAVTALASLLPQAFGQAGGGMGGRGTPLTQVGPNAPGEPGFGAGGIDSNEGGKPGDRPAPTAPNVANQENAAEMPLPDLDRAQREVKLLAAVRQQQSAASNRIAMLRDDAIKSRNTKSSKDSSGQAVLAAAVLSDAEVQRRQLLLDDAYTKFQAIRKAHPHTNAAAQARDEIMTIVSHWRSIAQWQRAAELTKKYLADNPTDLQLPALRQGVARDYLAWAGKVSQDKLTKQELLDEIARRFQTAREELSAIIAAFPENQSLIHQSQWDIANSHLSQARVVGEISRTLARGQFVRATNELLRTAELYHDHPNINQLPNMLWGISQELASRGFYDEAITVWNRMTIHYPGHALAEQAALQIAQTYRNQLRQPLRAAESYLELNFSRGGDPALQDAIFQIASQLKTEKRWVESLHLLETFVDGFPKHASAGQALAMIGDIHQTNQVWEDAIEAYRRVILQYDQGPWAQQAKWAIAECTINLSRWDEAQGAYREYQRAYPKDAKVAEATRRLEVLKDLARFQKVVDEQGQRKAFDAQFQIATIVRNQLANPVKAIIEYKKVAAKWPESHLADDALFQVGTIYMELREAEKARSAFLATAEQHPSSPLADDALFQVGASYEADAQNLAGVTRGQSVKIAKDIAQKEAYQISQGQRREQRIRALDQITKLRAAGKSDEADNKAAFNAARNLDFDRANAAVLGNWAAQQEAALTTAQLADRQDKINASLRNAVAMFRQAASVASADKADDALLRMAQIYDQRLKDSEAAMNTWLEIVKQYSGTTVAEDASWKIAQYYETHEKYADAITAYKSFLRNYRRSPKASAAQAAIAENHEQLGNWVEAMDAYTNYINNFPEGSMAKKAKEQIAWIKTYRL